MKMKIIEKWKEKEKKETEEEIKRKVRDIEATKKNRLDDVVQGHGSIPSKAHTGARHRSRKGYLQ
jgi:hypothetical protein